MFHKLDNSRVRHSFVTIFDDFLERKSQLFVGKYHIWYGIKNCMPLNTAVIPSI